MAGDQWKIREFAMADWSAAIGLWQRVPGMGLGASDSESAIAAFLARNPGLSLVAEAGSCLVGTVMAGNDGRRGYIYHACVDPAWQGRGIGGSLITECLGRLKVSGLIKISLYCKVDNEAGKAFWEHAGWQRRDDLTLFSWDC